MTDYQIEIIRLRRDGDWHSNYQRAAAEIIQLGVDQGLSHTKIIMSVIAAMLYSYTLNADELMNL